MNQIKSNDKVKAVKKLEDDCVLIKEAFGEYLAEKAMRPSIETLLDLEGFFTSSPEFLSVSVQKMRNIHGPAFNLNTIKALLALRHDLTSEEKSHAI